VVKLNVAQDGGIVRIQIDVIKAEVLLRDGTDLVSLTIDKPYPGVLVGIKNLPTLRLQFEVVRGHGVDYCQEHFGIFPDIINTRARGYESPLYDTGTR
jgi:hypothetical protein